MVEIFQAATEEDKLRVRELFWEYLQWANGQVNEHFGVDFDIEAILEDDMQKLDKFLPSAGRLLLAVEEDQAIGIACLKKLKNEIGEIKRMYVRPAGRRKGIGKALLERLISEAKEIGYNEVWLDSARYMAAAHKLYESFGFEYIDPYLESEIPAEFQQHWVFMKLPL